MNKLFTLLFLTVSTVTMTAQSFSVIENSSDKLYAKGISSDGKYVVGQVGNDQELKGNYTFVWTQEEGVEMLNMEDQDINSNGNSGLRISPTGRVVGVAPDPDRMVNTYETFQLPFITAAYRDPDAAKWTILPLLNGISAPFYGFGSKAYDVTDDGSIIVGSQTPGGQAEYRSAGYWQVSEQNTISYHSLLAYSPGNNSAVLAVSGNGEVMGGHENDNPVVWVNGTKRNITGSNGGQVRAVSNNGRFAVFQNAANFRAVIYDIEKNLLTKFDLNTNQGSYGYSTPLAVSNNGIVVGYSGDKANPYVSPPIPEHRKAFIYSKTWGMQNLADFLTGAGIDFQGMSLLVAGGISADGRKITGFGTKNGKNVSFYVEIPELPDGTDPVPNVSVASPAYGTVVLNWQAPEIPAIEDAPILISYKIYLDSIALETVDASVTSRTFEQTPDGSYSYYIQAIYNAQGVIKESVGSKTVRISMGKKTLPFFDDFSDYQPGGAIYEVMEVLEEIPLSIGYWDVSANTVPFSNSWKVMEFGYTHWCAGFTSPGGSEYDESLTSPYFDASAMDDLQLMFNLRVPASNNAKLAVEISDGAAWQLLEDIPANGQNEQVIYTFKKYDVSALAKKDNIRIRFRAHASSGSQIRWLIDNVELVDKANEITVADPLVISAREVKDEGTVHVNWSDPNGYVSLRYMWDDNVYVGAITNDKLPFIAANMYPAEDLQAYANYRLTSISFWRTTNPEWEGRMEEPEFRWFVSQGGERLFSAPVTTSQLKWNTIELDEPIAIDITKPLYYGVEVVDCNPNDWPVGTGTFYSLNADGGQDMLVADGRGNLYSEDDGQTWRKLSDEELPYDLFSIRATLAKDPSVQPQGRIRGYQVLRNGEKLLDQLLSGNDMICLLNNYTDPDPLPEETEACYTVKIYYSYQTFSEGVTDCVIREINGTALIKVENDLKVYPNTIKRNETIQVELSDNWNKAVIELYDFSGKKIKTVQATGPKTPVQVNVDTGVYILKINNKETVKLIVK